ncbi:MAG: hypothetical protein IJZ59_02155 [Alphaproteobacteria bacterium]|nr:hypothetical protein [Alphaproteobacteria bacterium]
MKENDTSRAYAHVYGSEPCSPMIYLRESPYAENFDGVTQKGNDIEFKFRGLDFWQSNSVFDFIEMHFRRRLCRKISFMTGHNRIVIMMNDDPEEREDYLTAKSDLESYFSGGTMHQSRLCAEYSLYQKGKNWRDKALVEAEMASISSKK